MSSIELEKSLLVIQNIFELLVNTLTPDGKPSLLNMDNLTQPIQLQISKKQRSFSHFLSVFSKSSSNFEHFQKKNDPQSICINTPKKHNKAHKQLSHYA